MLDLVCGINSLRTFVGFLFLLWVVVESEGFIKNNSGIDQGKSLPDDFLGGLYDRIASTPISLKVMTKFVNFVGETSSRGKIPFAPPSCLILFCARKIWYTILFVE